MSTEPHTEVWNRGRSDALADQRDETLYTQDTTEARLYRDGHRMGRRERNNDEHAGDVVVTAGEGPNELLVDAMAPSIAEPMAKFADDLHRQMDAAVGGAHPSAFSDPVPGHKPKRAKPSDPAQAFLF